MSRDSNAQVGYPFPRRVPSVACGRDGLETIALARRRSREAVSRIGATLEVGRRRDVISTIHRRCSVGTTTRPVTCAMECRRQRLSGRLPPASGEERARPAPNCLTGIRPEVGKARDRLNHIASIDWRPPVIARQLRPAPPAGSVSPSRRSRVRHSRLGPSASDGIPPRQVDDLVRRRGEKSAGTCKSLFDAPE